MKKTSTVGSGTSTGSPASHGVRPASHGVDAVESGAKPAISLQLQGKEHLFPVMESASGRRLGIDVTDFHDKTGYFLYDNQLKNIAWTKSSVSYREGSEILYRGFALSDLVKSCSFLEVAYLLIQGQLPNVVQYENFSDALIHHSLLHEDMNQLYDSFPVNTNPLGVLATLVTSISNYMKTDDGTDIDIKYQLLSKVRTLAAWAYKKNIGQATVYPRPELPYCANLLYMMFATRAEPLEISTHADALLNKLLILYSENNQNISTITVHMLARSGANLFVSINAGISALWGARDNYFQVMPMLGYMIDNKKSAKWIVEEWIHKEKKLLLAAIHKKTPQKTRRSPSMGVRTKIAASLFHNASDRQHFPQMQSDPFLAKALELEEYILQDAYCQDHDIFPNLDFYSTLLYRRLEIPESMFNVMRAIGKLAGWLAHWQEQISMPTENDLPMQTIQPTQIYQGPERLAFLPLAKR